MEHKATLIASAIHIAAKNATIKPMIVIIQRVRYFSRLDAGLIKYVILISLLFMGVVKVEENQIPAARNVNERKVRSLLLRNKNVAGSIVSLASVFL